MKKIPIQKNPVVIYQAKSGAIELRGDFSKETIWATQSQIADVFGVQRPAITKHLQNIYKTGELKEKSVCSILEHTAIDGKKYKTSYYNLDAIISIGYRINSQKATEFRIWATKTLREHITSGYTLNRARLAQNYDAFMKSVADIQALLPTRITIDPTYALDLVKEFASTWVSLHAYDKEKLPTRGTTKKSISITAAQLLLAVKQLMVKCVATLWTLDAAKKEGEYFAEYEINA